MLDENDRSPRHIVDSEDTNALMKRTANLDRHVNNADLHREGAVLVDGPQLRGAPTGHAFNVRDVYLNAGAGCRRAT